MALGYQLGGWGTCFYEKKNQRQNFSCQCPFKMSVRLPNPTFSLPAPRTLSLAKTLFSNVFGCRQHFIILQILYIF